MRRSAVRIVARRELTHRVRERSFLVGTCVTANRDWATVFGFVLYTLGGWAFALLYIAIFKSLGVVSWWYGAILGFLHGLFLLVVALPVMPHLHPRMASEYDEPGSEALLEPPGSST